MPSPSTSAGRERARTLIGEGRTYCEIVRIIVADFQVTERTAKRYINWARADGLLEEADIDVRSTESSRWNKIAQWDKRVRRLRGLADEHYALNGEERRGGLAYEREARAIDKMIADSLHFDKISPERDLDQPDQQDIVIDAIVRALPYFPREKILRMRDALITQLQGGPSEVDAQAEAEWQAECDGVI